MLEEQKENPLEEGPAGFALERDPVKWKTVNRFDRATIKDSRAGSDSTKYGPALDCVSFALKIRREARFHTGAET